jgi:hypothetical protein
MAKIVKTFFFVATCALVLKQTEAGSSTFVSSVSSAPPPSENWGNCPSCREGQKDKETYEEWKLWHLQRPGNPDGNCPGNRAKRIFNGIPYGLPNKCCCEPINNPAYPGRPPTGFPEK